MNSYVSKPVEVQAIQVCRKNLKEIIKLLGSSFFRTTNLYCCVDACHEDAPYVKIIMIMSDKVGCEHHQDLFQGQWIVIDQHKNITIYNPGPFRNQFGEKITNIKKMFRYNSYANDDLGTAKPPEGYGK